MATNWALASNGSSATATNFFTGYEPSKAIDGNNGTTYHSSTQSAITLEIDLGTTRLINQIVLKTLRTDSPGYDFGYSLDYWNGSAWVNIVTGQATTNGTGIDYTHNFSAVNASKVRLVTTGSKYTTVNEFEINGNPPDTTKPSDVTGLIATKISNSRIDIDSNSATDNVTVAGYQTQVSLDAGGTWATLTDTTKAFQFEYGDTGFPSAIGTHSLTFRRKAYDAAENYSENWSNIPTAVSITITAPPPVASFTMSKTLVVVGETIVLTDTSTNSPTSRQWKLDSENLATISPYNLNTAGLEPGTYSIGLDVENSGGTDSADNQTFTVVAFDPFYRGFEKLQIIPCLNAKETISFARFRHQLNDGFRKNILYGIETGTKRWGLSYRTLANNGEENYTVNGLIMSPAEYLWDFYCRHQVSGKPFLMISPRNSQYYLAEFADDDLSLEKIAVQLWTTGLQINQVRQGNDYVYQPLKFGNILQYEADSLELSDNDDVATWTEINGGASLAGTGGVTFQTNEQNSLPIVRLNGTDGFLSLSGSHTIYHAFFVLKVTENTFGGNDGIFGDADTNIISGVSGDDVLNNGANAPMQKWGVIYYSNASGLNLTTIQIGKNQGVSGTFLKADIAAIILSKTNKTQSEVLEMVEYLSTKWNVGNKINAE